MKKVVYYIFALLLFLSCQRDLDFSGTQNNKGDLIEVVGLPAAFSDINVDTKGVKDELEAEVSNMVFFVLDADDNIIYRKAEEGDKPVFVLDRASLRENNPSADLTACKLMIVANVKDLWNNVLLSTGSISTLNEINHYVFGIEKILTSDDLRAKNSPGLPMSGFYSDNGNYTLDLEPVELGGVDHLKGRVLNISLECLFAKVVFNIRVNPLQSASAVTGEKQSFTLASWQVFNVPTSLELGEPDPDDVTTYDGVLDSPVKTAATTPVVTEDTTKPMTFTFYVPEHKIKPQNNADYPWALGEPYNKSDYERVDGVEGKYYQYRDYRQYLKPTLVQDPSSPVHPVDSDQQAMYVEIKGSYVDHNTKSHDVTYTIYLGANPIDDFFILRNHQYNNNITIKGITNSVNSNGNWVTYDHRVSVVQEDFTFGLQRETLLDSHWEIRPIRIDFNQAAGEDAVAVITVPNACTWIGIESPVVTNSNKTTYCDVESDDVAYGKRRYFTTNLVNELSNKKIVVRRNREDEHTVASIDGQVAHTVWVYIDENTADTRGYRYATVTCDYYKDAATYNNGAGTPTVTEEYIFRQNNLFPVSNNEHEYLIEYYEEYLYNFDTKEDYGKTTDGMKWGLENVELSHEHSAVLLKDVGGSGATQLKNAVRSGIQNFAPKYDFYLQRDIVNNSLGSEGLEPRDSYSGRIFTIEISKIDDAKIGKLATNEVAKSAVEYCLNKNKRGTDGEVDKDHIHWYLPAIDEIEEICKGGYDEFEVFQDKLYWSSQPAFKRSMLEYFDRNQEGYMLPYFREDFGIIGNKSLLGRARATKVNDNFENVLSESYGIQSAISLVGTAQWTGIPYLSNGSWTNLQNGSYDCYPGNNINYVDPFTYNRNTRNFNLVFSWNPPSTEQEEIYKNTGIWPGGDNHAPYTITVANKTNDDKKDVNLTWKDRYYFYDEGNCSRDEVHRVRCVYKP